MQEEPYFLISPVELDVYVRSPDWILQSEYLRHNSGFIKISFIINIQCLNGMVPDMMAVYHLQKNKGTGVCALIWNSQITPIQAPQNFHSRSS